MSDITSDRPAPGRPEPLANDHDVESFDSGVPALDQWLTQRARRNESEGASRTFVTRDGNRVVGYYTLAAGSVGHAVATSKTRRNMPDPVPVVILGRLAVDRSWQGRGLGADLLRYAILRVVAAADTVGVRAILVHAISEEAKTFYERHGFRASGVEPMTLMITVDDARRLIG